MALISQNFKNDTNTGSFSIEPVVVVADLVEDKYNVLDIYSTTSYWFKDQDNIDVKQSKDILNKVSSVKSVIDYESKKIKSNTFRFSINNYFDINKKLTNSDDYSLTGGTSLNSLIGKHIILFYKTQTTENIYLLKDTNPFSTYDLEDDSKLCSIMFYGVINRVTQKKDIITIQAEDYTQDYLKNKELPVNNVGSLSEEIKNNLIETDLDKPVPMVFGNVDHAPTISYKTDIPNTQGFVSLGFISDSFPIKGYNHYLNKSGVTSPYHLFLEDDDDYVIVPYFTGQQPSVAKSYFVDIVDAEQSAYIIPELHEEAIEKESIYTIGFIPSSTFIGNPHTDDVGPLDSLLGIAADIENLNNTEAITREYNKKNMWSGTVLPDIDSFDTGLVSISVADGHSQWYLIGLKRDIVITGILGNDITIYSEESGNPRAFRLYGKPFDPEQFKLLFENTTFGDYLDYILNDEDITEDGQFPHYGNATLILGLNSSMKTFPNTSIGEELGPSSNVFSHDLMKSRFEESEEVNQFLLFDYANNFEIVNIGYKFKDLMFQYIKKYDNYVDEIFYSSVQGRKDYFSTEPINSLTDLGLSFNLNLIEAILGADETFPDFGAVIDEWDNYFASMYEVFPSDESILSEQADEGLFVDTFLWHTIGSTTHDTFHIVYDFAVKQGNGYTLKTTCDSDDATFFASPQIIETVLHGLMKKLYVNIWHSVLYQDTELWNWFNDAVFAQYGYHYEDVFDQDPDTLTGLIEGSLCYMYKNYLEGGTTSNNVPYLEEWSEIPERVENAISPFSQYRKLLLRRIFKYLYQSPLVGTDDEIDSLVTGFTYEWGSFNMSGDPDDMKIDYVENLGTYLDDTISTINKHIYDRGSRLQGTMSLEDWNEQFPDLDDNLRFGLRNELYVWNDSPDNITRETPHMVNLSNYISLDSLVYECFSAFSQDNTFESSGFIEKPTDIFMNILLRELKYGVKEEEVDSSAFDSVSIEKSRVYYDGWKMGFCLDEKKDAISLLDDICKETKSVFNFNSEGKASIITIANDYVYDDIDYTINKNDVSNYSITRTKREKIITSNKFYYRYDNGKGRYKRETPLLKADDLYDGYGGYNYYNIDFDITSQEKELRYHVDESTANDFLSYDLGQKINQHLLIDLDLPLSYGDIGLGSIIHIPLLEDDKAFGIDYSKLQTLNGQTLLPIWIVTGIDITIERVKIKAMQLHHIKKTISDVTSFALPDAVENIITVNTKRENSNYTYSNGDPILNWNYVNTDNLPDEFTVEDSGIEIPYGDVNGDQSIDIIDVVFLVSDILNGGNTLSVHERTRADVDSDGVVSVSDCVMLIDIIVGDWYE